MYKDITEENADYLVKLKVGQKCNMVTNKKITGHFISGNSCIKFNEEGTEFTAVKKGKANGYIYIGNNNEKKSIYIIVEENSDNQEFDAISIDLDNLSNNSNSKNTNNEKPDNSNSGEFENVNQNKNDNKYTNLKTSQTTNTTSNSNVKISQNDNTISNSTLPKTGITEIFIKICTITICFIFVVIFKRKNNKYRGIE